MSVCMRVCVCAYTRACVCACVLVCVQSIVLRHFGYFPCGYFRNSV